jgi:hypothetical protein
MPAAPPTDRSAYLWETLRALWPEPARIVRAGRGAPRTGRTEFLVLPSEARAVLLLPRRPRRAAAGALRHYKSSAAGPRRLLFRGLALGAAVGLADALPHRIRIESASSGPSADVAGYLRDVLGADVVVSIRIGPPRANRKPVLELLSPGGQVLGFAKVGITSLTRELVRAEAGALTWLGARPLTRLEVPQLLHHGQWHGHEILVQTPMAGSGRPGTQAELSAAMKELATVRGVTTQPVFQSQYWRDLRARLEACLPQRPAAALLRIMAELEAGADPANLTFGSWHGDWTPWNMTSSRGRALVWDWERFESGVPVGYDAVHYQLQGAVTGDGPADRAAAEAAVTGAPAALAPFGVEPGAAGFVAALYLLEIAARYLHDGAAEAGARLGDVGSWLLPVLTRHASRLCAQPDARGVRQ